MNRFGLPPRQPDAIHAELAAAASRADMVVFAFVVGIILGALI